MNVQWIVNNIGELGVLVNGEAHFMYKGKSFVYEEGGSATSYRPVEKREFGESGPTIEQNVDAHQWTPLPTKPNTTIGVTELVNQLGNDNIKFQTLDSSLTNLSSTKKQNKFTFVTDQEFDVYGPTKFGLVIWADRDKVKQILGN